MIFRQDFRQLRFGVGIFQDLKDWVTLKKT